MLGSLFKKKSLLDEEATEWLFNNFAWALRNFGTDVFESATVLVEPSNRHFPGRESSEHGMAALIFEQVKGYAGLSHWPCQLVDRNDYDESEGFLIDIHQTLASMYNDKTIPLLILYEPLQARNPQVMIANFAYALAFHLAALARENPPCDDDQWPYLLELIGVYMGFGIMFANTALPKRGGGCGSCRSPLMERHGLLSENEVTYGLAIFCALRNIPARVVTPFLKRHQRSFLQKAIQEVLQRTEQIDALKTIRQVSQVRGTSISHER